MKSLRARFLKDARVVMRIRLKEDDASVEGHEVENDGKSCDGIVRIGAADARPPGALLTLASLRAIGDEDGIIHG